MFILYLVLEPVVSLLLTLSVDPFALKSGSKILPDSTWEATDQNFWSDSFFNEADAHVFMNRSADNNIEI